MPVAVEPDAVIIDLAEDPDATPNPCVEALVQYLPPTNLTDALFVRLGLHGDVEWMSQFLHMSPKGRRGRPKGSWRRVSPQAIELWKQGNLPAKICEVLKIPYTERKSFKASLRSAIRRLPKDQRLAGLKAIPKPETTRAVSGS